ALDLGHGRLKLLSQRLEAADAVVKLLVLGTRQGDIQLAGGDLLENRGQRAHRLDVALVDEHHQQERDANRRRAHDERAALHRAGIGERLVFGLADDDAPGGLLQRNKRDQVVLTALSASGILTDVLRADADQERKSGV